MADGKKRYVVVYRSGAGKAGAKLLSKQAGVSFANEIDAAEGKLAVAATGEDPIVLFDLEMAVVTMDDQGRNRVAAATTNDAVLFVEEERMYQLQMDRQAATNLPSVPLAMPPYQRNRVLPVQICSRTSRGTCRARMAWQMP
jgi:hypothetical protein